MSFVQKLLMILMLHDNVPKIRGLALFASLFFDAVSNVFTVPTGRGGKDDKHQLQRYVHVN